MPLHRQPVDVRLVINGDDLGISSEVNEAILHHIDLRQITSCTIMANGPAFSDAISRIATFPDASFGVHLNATEFAPLTSNPDLGPLLDRDHRFAGNIRHVKVDSRLRWALATEWIAQVDKVRRFGINVSHLDSHHHIHTCPKLFWVLKHVQRHCQIRKVRIAKNIYSRSLPPSTAWKPVQKATWNCLLRHALYRTTSTEGMTDLSTFVESPTRRFSTVELMTHPGSSNFERETEILSKPWIENLPFRATLVNYHDI